MVVVSISAWDGYRILGVFQSEEKAKKAVEELKISNVDRVSYDIVEVGKISYSQEIKGNSEKSTIRKHIYESMGLNEESKLLT
jgi:hypothetical protein